MRYWIGALFNMLTSMLSYIADKERKKMLERQSAGITRKTVYRIKSELQDTGN